jgi:rfaE bifunctional protein nucleotidyltransferase chain/domain
VGEILSWDQAADRRRLLAEAGLALVFTNGCFDLLHPGHLRYLAEARALGGFLLVGLNSDRSVRALGKGPERPILNEEVRAEMLAGLKAVDAVTIFDQETPLELITLLAPDVLVKGGDWPPDSIVGAGVVRGRGGLVRSLTLAPGFSTTGLLELIRRKS